MVEPSVIAKAAELLRQGGLVALPTETVYGLGADAENELGVRRIFAVKGRPQTHPLIVHVSDAASAAAWAREFPQNAQRLAAAFWPGPLTLVLPRSRRASDAVTGGQDTVALRVPAHPVMRAVLGAFGGAIAAPSANRFGRVSATSAEHVRSDLGDQVDLVIDAGPCPIGLESTIVDLTSQAPAVLRPGAVPLEELQRVLGHSIPLREGDAVRVPGSMRSHYAPRAGVELLPLEEVAGRVRALQPSGAKLAVICADKVDLRGGAKHFPVPADAAGFARALYATFREVDRQGFDLILVVPPPASGLGLAIRDRLARAASPRR
jgi:L-threonylcarbamoyladenylate synthase